MDWVTEHIAIGNFIDARALTPSTVDAVLCLKEHCCDEHHEEICVVKLPLIDGPGNDFRLLQQAIDFIDEIVSVGDKILVHCHAGRSRSVCVVARYLMSRHGMTRDRAIATIAEQRKIYLSPGIEELLTVPL